MKNSNNVLTVSYGAFSCTLEGFEDSFSIVSVLAGYFSDLAQKDPLFGAHPPHIDADFLMALAQKELRQSVNMKIEENSIKMSPSSSTKPDQAPQSAPMPKSYLDSVAERLAQIRNVTLKSPNPSLEQAAQYKEDNGIESAFDDMRPLGTEPQQRTTHAEAAVPVTKEAVPPRDTPELKAVPTTQTQENSAAKPAPEVSATPASSKPPEAPKSETPSETKLEAEKAQADARAAKVPFKLNQTLSATQKPKSKSLQSKAKSKEQNAQKSKPEEHTKVMVAPDAKSSQKETPPSAPANRVIKVAQSPQPEKSKNAMDATEGKIFPKGKPVVAEPKLNGNIQKDNANTPKPVVQIENQTQATKDEKPKDAAPKPAQQLKFKPKIISPLPKAKLTKSSQNEKSADSAEETLKEETLPKTEEAAPVVVAKPILSEDTSMTPKPAQETQEGKEPTAEKTADEGTPRDDEKPVAELDKPEANPKEAQDKPQTTASAAPQATPRAPAKTGQPARPSSAPLDLSAFMKRRPSQVIEHPALQRQNVASAGNTLVAFSDEHKTEGQSESAPNQLNEEAKPIVEPQTDKDKTKDPARADSLVRDDGDVREYKPTAKENGKRVLRMNGEDFIRAVEQGRLRELRDPASAAAPAPKKQDLNSDDPFTRELAQLDAQLREAHQKKHGDTIKIKVDRESEAVARQLDKELSAELAQESTDVARPKTVHDIAQPTKTDEQKQSHRTTSAPEPFVLPSSIKTSSSKKEEIELDETPQDHEVAASNESDQPDHHRDVETKDHATAPPKAQPGQKTGKLEDRIFSQAAAKMDQGAESDNYNVLSHLRNAAAARPEQGDARPDERPSKAEPTFRADLEAVEPPARPMMRNPNRAARPTNRIAAPTPNPKPSSALEHAAPTASDPIMPRRVGAATPPDEKFVAFIEDVGATTLSELLEAAASYIHFVEGQEAFTRPQLMTRVRRVKPSGFSREDALRFFGQLLRDGKIEKLRAGKFRITDEIEFRPL